MSEVKYNFYTVKDVDSKNNPYNLSHSFYGLAELEIEGTAIEVNNSGFRMSEDVKNLLTIE